MGKSFKENRILDILGKNFPILSVEDILEIDTEESSLFQSKEEYARIIPSLIVAANEGSPYAECNPITISRRIMSLFGCASNTNFNMEAVYLDSFTDLLSTDNDESFKFVQPISPEDWISGTAILGGDINPFLSTWEAIGSTSAALQLARFAMIAARAQDNFPAPYDMQIHYWLRSDRIKEILKSAADSCIEDAWVAETALSMIYED
jgi:hypothetical protein